MGPPDPIPDPLVELLANRPRVIGEPTRIRVLDRLRHGPASVQELVNAAGTRQQNVSKHLTRLTDLRRSRRSSTRRARRLTSLAPPAGLGRNSSRCHRGGPITGLRRIHKKNGSSRRSGPTRPAPTLQRVRAGPLRVRRLRTDPAAGAAPHYKIARDVAGRVDTALQHAGTYLNELDYQHQGRVAFKAAEELRRHGRPIGQQTCDDAAGLVDFLGRGSGRRNHVVYWAPPAPPENLPGRYIGRSRAMDQRCVGHPVERANAMTTLNLLPLNLDEARNVEEALIAHWGTTLETPNDPGQGLGQLANVRHEIDRLRPDYGARLLAGQAILDVSGYGPYAGAFYTRGVVCPGVGGPR